MKLESPANGVLEAALAGDLKAIDALLRTLQSGVFNLSVRMLGNRDDAADATQEILLKVITHLASFRHDASFTTWVFQIARNHLLSALSRAKEHPEISLDAIGEKLSQGLELSERLMATEGEKSLSPEDKLASRQIAIGCTQSMLMALDRDHRLAYLLDTIFGLSSDEAASVLDIAAPAYRKRLSRARAQLDEFASASCGLVSTTAKCHCDQQVTSVKFVLKQSLGDNKASPKAASLKAQTPQELSEAERQFDSILRLSDSAALFRAHPEYHMDLGRVELIRAVLIREGHWPDGGPALRH